jgi:ATP-dependent 26S proteasome regulatory subunit
MFMEAKFRLRLCPPVRQTIKGLEDDFEKSEDDIKALQSVGQIIGEVLKQLDEERCQSTFLAFDQNTHPPLVVNRSYRQSIFRSTLCCWVSFNSQ